MKNTQTTSLRDAVQAISEKSTLSTAELAQLQSQMAMAETPAPTPNARWYFAVAASVVVIIMAGLLFFPSTSNVDGQEEYDAQWARLIDTADDQVATNHIHRKPLEVQSNSFTNLVSYFAELDFQLLEPLELTKNGAWEIIGGRYTNILGHDAAQIIMRETATGKEQSLYQAKLTSEEAGAAPAEDTTFASVDGVRMKFWVDGGVLCAMTVN